MDLARYVFRSMFSRGGLEFRRRADGAVEVWRTEGEHPLITVLRSALENWGRHHPWCASLHTNVVPPKHCDCGLAKQLEAKPDKERVAIIPANEWASIVTSLTTEGENGTSFAVFLALHCGGTAYDSNAHEYDADPEPEWMRPRKTDPATITVFKATEELPEIFRTPRCTVAHEKTNGAYTCTRAAGHDGPCAAAPNGIPCE